MHDNYYSETPNLQGVALQIGKVNSQAWPWIARHDVEGQLSIVVIEGEGEFLGNDGLTLPANTGDVLISDIREPHGILAISDMRVIVTIAPPVWSSNLLIKNITQNLIQVVSNCRE